MSSKILGKTVFHIIFDDIESELITAVHSLNADSVNKAVDMLIKMNSAFAPTDEQFILLTTMFYGTISRILSEINAVPRQVFGDDVIIYLELRKCGSLESLKEKIIELLGVTPTNRTTIK